MTAITVLQENVPHGPFTREEVADKLGRGEITLESLAFVEGLTQWTPLREVLEKVDGMHPAPPPVSALPETASHAHTPTAETAALIGTGYSYAVTMQPPGHLVYAGFWLRLVALLVDIVVLLPLFLLYGGVYAFTISATNDTLRTIGGIAFFFVWLLVVVGQWLYFAMQESSGKQATLGKRLLGLQVVDRAGNRIGFGRATGRYFGKIVSALPLYVGFMLAGWTERKQALHDMLADTLVVRKPKA